MSNMNIDEVLHAFADAESCWLSTTRSNGSPHVVPVWFVWHEGAAWVYSAATTVHTRNVRQRPQAVIHLADTHEALILDVAAEVIAGNTAWAVEALGPLFMAKYALDVVAEHARHETAFVRFAPQVVRAWGKAGFHRWRLTEGKWQSDGAFAPF